MSYTVKEITVKFDLTAKSVYDAAAREKIDRVADTKPIQYTKESVDRYWSRRDPQFKKSHQPQTETQEKLQDHENRLKVIEERLSL